MTIAELMQKFGVTNPNQLFGGSLGLLKTDSQNSYDDQGFTGSGYSDALAKLAKSSSNEQQIRDVNSYGFEQGNGGFNFSTPSNSSIEESLASPKYQYLLDNPDFLSGKKSLDESFSKLNKKLQVTPELLQRTLTHQQKPEGFYGNWINDLNSVQYSPEFGAYIQGTGANNNDYGLGQASAPTGNFFKATLSDPQFTLPLAYAGAVASGIGAASSAAGGASAPAASGIGEFGAMSSIPVAPGSAGAFGWGAASGLTPAELAGASGAFGSAASSYPGFDPEYANISGGVDGPINSFGGASNNWGDILRYGSETGNYSSVLDKLKGSYDSTVKPVNQANSALKMLGGGSSSGGTGPILHTQNEGLPEAAGGSIFQGGGLGAGFGAGPPGSGYGGFPGFGTPAYGGLPQTPQYQPQQQQPQGDQNWFIPEYLKRGVIGR